MSLGRPALPWSTAKRGRWVRKVATPPHHLDTQHRGSNPGFSDVQFSTPRSGVQA